jgi:hypothetical protein
MAEHPVHDEGLPGWPPPGTPTGDPAVDVVLQQLEGLPDTPVMDHAGVYDSVHERLLSALDEDPAAAIHAPAPGQRGGSSRGQA